MPSGDRTPDGDRTLDGNRTHVGDRTHAGNRTHAGDRTLAGRSPEPDPTAPEIDTPDDAAWSGARIQKYIKAFPGLPLMFEKHNIRIAIPADSPVLSSIRASDTLHVKIQPLSADTVFLEVRLNDVPLTDLPLTVTVPGTGESPAQEVPLTDGSENRAAQSSRQTPEPPSAAIFLLFLSFFGIGAFLFRFRRHARKGE